MTKSESRIAQIRLLVEEIQERHKRHHPEAKGCEADTANAFVRAVALLVDRPFRGNTFEMEKT